MGGGMQWLQTCLWEEHGVRTLRASLAQLAEGARLDAQRQLWYSDHLVSVVYFRAGYSPDDYPSDKEWRARCANPPPPWLSCACM